MRTVCYRAQGLYDQAGPDGRPSISWDGRLNSRRQLFVALHEAGHYLTDPGTPYSEMPEDERADWERLADDVATSALGTLLALSIWHGGTDAMRPWYDAPAPAARTPASGAELSL